VVSKINSSRLDLLQKFYNQLIVLKHSMNNLLMTLDSLLSYIPRNKGEIHYKKSEFPIVLNLCLNVILSKEEAPLFKLRPTTSLKDLNHGIGSFLVILSKQVGDEAHFHLLNILANHHQHPYPVDNF